MHPFPEGATEARPKAPVVGKITTSRMAWGALEAKQPPGRKWAIKGWLGFGHITLLVGQGGIGKTLIAQQIGSALAVGAENFIDEIPHPMKVLMWACEDDHDELWRRQICISQYLKQPLGAFQENFALVPRHGLSNSIATSEYGKLTFTGLERHLKEQVEDFGADVVILDNVAQLYGGNENDRHAVTTFLNLLTGLLDYRAVLLLAHPSRGMNSEFSGSSAWENVARSRLYLGAKLPDQNGDDEGVDPNTRYLARRKANYAEKDYRRCTYKDGVLVPEESQGGTGMVGVLRAGRAESVVVAGLRKLAEAQQYATDSANSPRYLPKVLGDFKLLDGISRAEVADAMRRMLLEGKIERGEVAKNSNRTPVFGLLAKPQ